MMTELDNVFSFAVKIVAVSFSLASATPISAIAKPEISKHQHEWQAWRGMQDKETRANPISPFTLNSTTILKRGSKKLLLTNHGPNGWHVATTDDKAAENQPQARAEIEWREKDRFVITSGQQTIAIDIGSTWSGTELGKTNSAESNFAADTSKNKNLQSLGIRSRILGPGFVKLFVHDTDRNSFKSPPYFAFDERFVVRAKLIRRAQPLKVDLKKSGQGPNEKVESFLIGDVEFAIHGAKKKLQVYTFESPNSLELFIPFKDKSNATETYSGGRYLEPTLTDVKQIEFDLDFNRAHNPFCAYNHEYSCVMPPPENALDVSIQAGETRFTK